MRRVVCSVLFVLLGLSPCLAAPDDGDRWIRVDTPNFVLFGNAGKSRVVEIGQNLERLREVLSQITRGMSVHSPSPTYIYVFKNDRSFGLYKLDASGQPSALAGYFVAASDANYVAVDAAAGDSPFAVIYHEYLHDFMNNNLPNLPRWLDEGFAEFYSTFRVRGDRAEVGRYIPSHLVTLNASPPIPLRRLFTITVESDEYHGERAGTFYAQSWALTHYLIVGSEEKRKAFNRYVNLLNQGADSIEAFSSAFGIDLEQAEHELRNYVKQQRFGYLPYELDTAVKKQKPKIVPLDRRETLYRLGELAVHGPPAQLSHAEALYREALRLDERHAPSWVGLGRVKDRLGMPDEAASFYEKAIASDSAYAPAYARYGQSLLDRYIEDSGGSVAQTDSTPEIVLKSRNLFEKSLQLDPGAMNALAGYGKTFFFGQDDLEAGIAALTSASAALPSRSDILYDLLILHVRAGHRSEARKILDDALRFRADEQLLAHAELAVVSMDLGEAERLLAEGKIDEAVAVLERVAARTRDPDLAKRIRAQIGAALSFRDAESMLGLYNLAMATINAGDYEKALAILERLVPGIDDPELKAKGQAHIIELKELTRHNRAVERYNRAVQAANEGDYGAAIRLLEWLLADETKGDLRDQAARLLSDLREMR